MLPDKTNHKRHCEHCHKYVDRLCSARESCPKYTDKSDVTPPQMPAAQPYVDPLEIVPPRLAFDPSKGVKFDGGKPRMELISRAALEAEARVLAFGASKYAADNWRLGMEWRRLGGAALRHLTAWLDGEDVDPETGESHLAHLRCCSGFLIEFQKFGLGTDDRYKRPAA